MTEPSSAKRIVVLISGSGSNLQSIIDYDFDQKVEIVAVISNRPDAYGLKRAKNAQIKSLCINHKDYDSRELFDQELATTIDTFKPDIVVLAGFMRILTPVFVNQFKGMLLNIHPSLLPKYPGLNTHQRAIEAEDSEAGATVHFVTAELDGGPPIAHVAVEIIDREDADSLQQKVIKQEHRLYPAVIDWFANDRLRFDGQHAFLDDKVIPATGIRL